MPKDTSIEIPQSLEDWVHQWLFEMVQSDAYDLDTHSKVCTFARAISYDLYRHLSAPVSSPSIDMGSLRQIAEDDIRSNEADYSQRSANAFIRGFIRAGGPQLSPPPSPSIESEEKSWECKGCDDRNKLIYELRTELEAAIKTIKGTQEAPAVEPDGHSLVFCPACGGDGKETCNNPDHGFIEAMPGETGRLGCPVCGYDPNHKVNRGRNVCPLCGGHGNVIYDVAEEYAKETGYDEEFVPYQPAPSAVEEKTDDEHYCPRCGQPSRTHSNYLCDEFGAEEKTPVEEGTNFLGPWPTVSFWTTMKDKPDYVAEINEKLKEGWIIDSISCGNVDSESIEADLNVNFRPPFPKADTGVKEVPEEIAAEINAQADVLTQKFLQMIGATEHDGYAFHMGTIKGAIALYRYLSEKGMLTEPDDTWHHKVDRMYEVICTGEDHEKELQAELSALKEKLLVVTADWTTERDSLKSEIELLRKNGASLRPGISILSILAWAYSIGLYKEAGFWRKNLSSIAYTDERIVEECVKALGVEDPEKLMRDRLRASGVALLIWGEKNHLRRTVLGAWEISRRGDFVHCRDAAEVYDQFLADEAKKNANHQPE